MSLPRPAPPLKVVHIVRQFAPSVGGLEEAVLKLCLSLRPKGIEASVITLDRVAKGATTVLPAIDDVEGIAVRRIPFSGSWRYPLAPGVLRHLRDADVVHVHAIDFFFDFMALTRPWHRKPLIASTHGGFFHTAFARRLKQLYFHTTTRTAARAYRAVCASSQSDFALFEAITPANLVLVENGVDIAKWSDLAPAETQRTLLYIGRFSANKQLETLLPLLRALRGLHPDWRLVIAGRPWDVGAGDLLRLAEAQGIASALAVLTDPSDAMLADCIRTASYVVSASRHEGFGISIVEGLSAGLVPILNRIPPFEMLAREAGTGSLIDVSAPVAAAEQIETLHRSVAQDPAPHRAACMAAAARYGWSAAADRYARLYDEAAFGTGPRIAKDLSCASDTPS